MKKFISSILASAVLLSSLEYAAPASAQSEKSFAASPAGKSWTVGVVGVTFNPLGIRLDAGDPSTENKVRVGDPPTESQFRAGDPPTGPTSTLDIIDADAQNFFRENQVGGSQPLEKIVEPPVSDTVLRGRDSEKPGLPGTTASPASASARSTAIAPKTFDPSRTSRSRLEKTAAGELADKPAFDGGGALGGLAGNEKVAAAYNVGIRLPPETKIAIPWGVEKLDSPKVLSRNRDVASVDRFHLAPDHVVNGFAPITLTADPSNMKSIEEALRQWVDSDPAQFGTSNKYGGPGEDMNTVHVEPQGTSIVAVFRQSKMGGSQDGASYPLSVDGAILRFHIKVLGGKPVVMGIEGRFEEINPAIMTPGFTDEQLEQIALKRLDAPRDSSYARVVYWIGRRAQSFRRLAGGTTPAPNGAVFLQRSIAFVANAWRAINIYQVSDLRGQPIIVVVDIKTGQAWAFDPAKFRSGQFGLILGKQITDIQPAIPKNILSDLNADALKAGHAGEASQGPKVEGIVTARGTTLTRDGADHGPTGPMPLAKANVYDDRGNVLVTTAEDGSFAIPGKGAVPIDVVIGLDGIYGAVHDDDVTDPPLLVKMSVMPGQIVRVTLNPTGDDEQEDAAVNAYVWAYKLFQWAAGVLELSDDSRLFSPLKNGIHANNAGMAGNAYYAAQLDAFFLMKRATVKVRDKDGRVRSLTFENTAQPSIIFHELGHRFVHLASQIRLTPEQVADPAFQFVQWLLNPIMSPDVNEGFADMISMFIRNNPYMGAGFIINPPTGEPNLIRSGKNITPYDENNPDPHHNGETLMQTGWSALIDLVGSGLMTPAEAALKAAALFVRTTLYAQPGSVPNALMHILLADMNEKGEMPHADIIRRRAKERGVDIPMPPSKPVS